MKLPPQGAEMFHADVRTDVMNLTVTFHSFVNASKSGSLKVTGICFSTH